MFVNKPCTKPEEEICIEVYPGWVADLTWISRSDRGVSHAFCRVCNSHFCVAAGGKHDAFHHATRSLYRTAQRNDRVTLFFVNPKDQEITKRVIVIETLFANMVAEHNLSFQLTDHFTLPFRLTARKLFARHQHRLLEVYVVSISPEMYLFKQLICTSEFLCMCVKCSSLCGSVTRASDFQLRQKAGTSLSISHCSSTFSCTNDYLDIDSG